MGLQVVDRDEGHAPGQRQRLGARHADQQRADEAGADRAGHGVDAALGHAGLDDRRRDRPG